MKKIKNRYIIIYIIDIVLTIICIALIIYYYLNLSVGWDIFDGELFGFAQFDLAQFWLIFFLLILLFCSLTALSAYLIVAIRQNKENRLEKSTKLGIVIIPAMFCMLLPVVTGTSVAITTSESLNSEWLCSDPDFEKWIKANNTSYPLQYYYQENCFGKVVDLKYYALTPDDDEFDLYIVKDFNCYFRKSNYPKIFSKFVKIPPRFYNEEYEETRNGIRYTVYTYVTEDKQIYYYVVIKNDNSYFLGEYISEKSDKISDYSLDDFVDDVFVNYNSWNAE